MDDITQSAVLLKGEKSKPKPYGQAQGCKVVCCLSRFEVFSILINQLLDDVELKAGIGTTIKNDKIGD